MDDQPIEEVPQDLVAGGFVVGMILIAEQGTQLTLAHLEIHQGEDLDDVRVLKPESYAKLLEDVVIAQSDCW